MRSTISVHYGMYMCVYADICQIDGHFSNQCPPAHVQSKPCTIEASHECSPVQIDLPTTEMDVRSKGNNSVRSKVVRWRSIVGD